MGLIDADALKKEVESIMSETMDMSFQIYAQGFCTTIDNAPTIDAVRHGTWTVVANESGVVQYGICSECNAMSFDGGNFCPNCGAKMDGGAE